MEKKGGDVEEGCHMSSKTSVAESVSQKRQEVKSTHSDRTPI